MKYVMGTLLILCGVGVICAAAAVEVLWLGFCFGTVIVGVVLLFTVPAILFAPLVALGGIGYTLVTVGVMRINDT